MLCSCRVSARGGCGVSVSGLLNYWDDDVEAESEMIGKVNKSALDDVDSHFQ